MTMVSNIGLVYSPANEPEVRWTQIRHSAEGRVTNGRTVLRRKLRHTLNVIR